MGDERHRGKVVRPSLIGLCLLRGKRTRRKNDRERSRWAGRRIACPHSRSCSIGKARSFSAPWASFSLSSYSTVELTVVGCYLGRPLRFTGQLLFDASHSPCTSGHRANPPRRALFAIHPVYGVDVCRTAVNPDKNAWLQQCQSGDDGNWVSLETWLGNDASEQESPDSSS